MNATEQKTEEKPLSKWQRELKEKFDANVLKTKENLEKITADQAQRLLGDGLMKGEMK